MTIQCTYTLNTDDLNKVSAASQQVVHSVVGARAGQQFQNPGLLMQYMQSPEGVSATTQVAAEVSSLMDRLRSDPNLTLGLTIDSQSGPSAADPLAGNVIAFLDSSLPPSVSNFSFFPADRALPIGEVNLQLGAPDAQQQLESHNSQPQLKYTRLKHLVINELIISATGNDRLKAEFEAIFSAMLRDRRISSIGVNELGMLSVMTEEVSTGRLIELDSLSSGEKNVALTFLIVSASVAQGGVVLFDEPELHLNPAVSRELLPFAMKRYVKGKTIQFIMSTHAPEIVRGAFDDADCALLHLKSGTDISRVGKRALSEYSDALTRLGTSVTESLLYEGTLFVEGPADKVFLEVAFPDLVRRYVIKPKGGRSEVEKTIKELQAMESGGKQVAPIYLVFDRDNAPTWLEQTRRVRFIQWKRRCLENYFIDEEVISALLADDTLTSNPIKSVGEVHNRLRELALNQLAGIAAKQAYGALGYESPGARADDLVGKDFSEIATHLYARFETSQASMPTVDRSSWVASFIDAAAANKAALELTWTAKWRDLCDGKQLLHELHRSSSLKVSEEAFKDRIVRRMRDEATENWELIKAQLTELFRAPTGN